MELQPETRMATEIKASPATPVNFREPKNFENEFMFLLEIKKCFVSSARQYGTAFKTASANLSRMEFFF